MRVSSSTRPDAAGRQIADDTAHPTFAAAQYEVEGLLGWIVPGGTDWDTQLAEGNRRIWTYRSEPPIKVFEDETVRITAYVRLSAAKDSFDPMRRNFGESAILEVASKRGRVELSELHSACTRFVRLFELMLYSKLELRLSKLYYTPEGRDYGLEAISRHGGNQDFPRRQDRPAVRRQDVASMFDAVCIKWAAAFARNSLPYHRLAASLPHAVKDPLEQQFLNICAAIAAWVEHGGGSGSNVTKHQLKEVTSIAARTFGQSQLADLSVEVVTYARHYLAHGNPNQKPQQVHQGSWFLWGWTRKLTACLWASVMSELGVPAEVIRGAASRSTALRYDAFDVHLAEL